MERLFSFSFLSWKKFFEIKGQKPMPNAQRTKGKRVHNVKHLHVRSNTNTPHHIQPPRPTIPRTTRSHQKDLPKVELPNCVAVSNSKWFMYCPFYKGHSQHPTFGRSLGDVLCRKGPYTKNANLDLLDHPFPSGLGVNDKVIPYEVFNLRLVPWFMIEHLVIMLNPESPKRNTT